MGLFGKLVDAILFVFYVVIAVVVLPIDAQFCLPARMFPKFLTDLTTWYIRYFGDYVLDEKPLFAVGLIWLELFFQWPLALANLYAMVTRKPWFPTTCLIYGVSVFTAMVAFLSEMVGSGRSSNKLLMMYFPFFGFGFLAMLRGLKLQADANKPASAAMGRKKRA